MRITKLQVTQADITGSFQRIANDRIAVKRRWRLAIMGGDITIIAGSGCCTGTEIKPFVWGGDQFCIGGMRRKSVAGPLTARDGRESKFLHSREAFSQKCTFFA